MLMPIQIESLPAHIQKKLTRLSPAHCTAMLEVDLIPFANPRFHCERTEAIYRHTNEQLANDQLRAYLTELIGQHKIVRAWQVLLYRPLTPVEY